MLLGALVVAALCLPSPAAAADASVSATIYVYDAQAATMTLANTRVGGARGERDDAGDSPPSTSSNLCCVATKGAGRSADNLPPIRGGAPGAGGRASKLRPNDDALGPHTVFRRGQDGRIDKYTIFDDFGNETLRFRGSGGSHAGLDPPLFYGAKPGKGPGAPLNRARNPGPDDYQNLPPGY